ncbi:hypothetical protein [Nocardioides pocheonensis]|jgi:MFS family permease|uniref:Uncharacterized protein n=1 Tax=Nocardioides pocheonensis TaxID=661485 RepID=A0A3N0GVZ4_9ACTN|nr:hypothetical protein [Nocardioides pocheonensis]RNM16633.1 hypothetical protein EFL26_03620 [Nocardioides pocheonensis]
MTHIHEHDVDRRDETEVVARNEAYDKFGGTNAGAGFFGWLVAVAVTALLTGIVGAVATAVGDAQNVTQSDAEREAGTVGLVSAIVLVAVLVIGYYAGGYVAGRMSRFDGARQGAWVWAFGLVATIVAVAAGWAFGAKYNVLDRVDLPRIPIPHDQMTTGGILTAIVLLAGTLLAAIAGGKVGQHYHTRVDRYADR